MKNTVKTLDGLKKYKFLILAAALGVVLLLLPSHSSEAEPENSDEKRLESLLEQTEGVGESSVLLSENGAVIVCEGAENADVKLSILKAAGAFTGFSTDKIQILKLEMED